MPSADSEKPRTRVVRRKSEEKYPLRARYPQHYQDADLRCSFPEHFMKILQKYSFMPRRLAAAATSTCEISGLPLQDGLERFNKIHEVELLFFLHIPPLPFPVGHTKAQADGDVPVPAIG